MADSKIASLEVISLVGVVGYLAFLVDFLLVSTEVLHISQSWFLVSVDLPLNQLLHS